MGLDFGHGYKAKQRLLTRKLGLGDLWNPTLTSWQFRPWRMLIWIRSSSLDTISLELDRRTAEICRVFLSKKSVQGSHIGTTRRSI